MEEFYAHSVEILKACLHPDPTTRNNAEQAIKEVCDRPGFLSILFRVSMEQNAPMEIRQFAVILMKNEVLAKWAKYKFDPNTDLKERLPCHYSLEEQNFIRGNLINAIIHVPGPLRTFLGVSFGAIAYADFPSTWPDLIDVLLQNAQSADATTIFAACYCFCLLFRKFAWQDKKKDVFHSIIAKTFPVLLQIWTNISTIDNNESAEIQLLLCKIFHSSLVMGIPPYFLDTNVFFEWLRLLMNLYSKAIPIPQNVPRSEIYQSSSWWKAQKWSIQICHKLIAARARHDSSPTTQQFLVSFLEKFAVPIQDAVLQRLSVLQSGGYLPPRAYILIETNLIESMLPAVTYKALTPHIQPLLESILFPLLYFTEEDQEIWESDPAEFIRREHDVVHDDLSPKKIGLEFLYDLVTQRKKIHLSSFVNFVISKLNQYQQSAQKNIQDKYAALSVFCTLSSKLKASEEFCNFLEEFVAVHVLPELGSSFPFMRAKACWTFCLFSDLEYRNTEVFAQGIHRTLLCMQDEELPVQVIASIGLKFAVNNPLATSILQPNLSQILDLYLKLLSQIENDELITALEYLIMQFQEEIGPHALGLLQNFWHAFLRIIEQEDDEATGLASLECLKAILVVLTAIQERGDLYQQAEAIILPSLKQAINVANLEYLEDFTRIISCFACFSPSISDDLWEFIPILYQQFDAWALDFIPNILVSIDNIISGDSMGFAKRNYFPLLYNMFCKVLSLGSNEMMESAQVAACQLIELGIQNSHGTANEYIEGILGTCISRMKQKYYGIALPTVLYNVFGNVFYYNPAIALAVLEKHQWTEPLFSEWFSFFGQYKRVYDRKVTVLGLSSLFLLPPGQWPAVVSTSIQNIFNSCLALLSDAMKLRVEKEKEKHDSNEKAPTFADEALVNVIRNALSSQNMGELDADENTDLRSEYGTSHLEDSIDEWVENDPNDLEDEDDVTTAIDSVNEVVFFFQAINVLQQNDQGLFVTLCSNLEATERNLMSQLNEVAKQGVLPGGK